MGEDRVFNHLSQELPLEERTNLLEKLKNQSSLSREPLYTGAGEDSTVDVKTRFAKLAWYHRLWYWLVSLFKNRPALKLFEDREIAQLGRQIEAQAPGIYDPVRGLLLPDFYELLNKLKESSRFFYAALDSSVNQDKGAFYAFLGSLEMGTVHARLEKETKPEFILEQHPDVQTAEIRQIGFRILDEILKTISADERKSMYTNARSLICLKQLSSFLFDRMLMAFSVDSAVGGMVCSAAAIRDSLASLNSALFSFKEIPPMPLLESLFIFILQEQTGEQGFNINAEIHRLLNKAETALATIRVFNQQVPLTTLCCCASRDTGVSPREISGGEDWFLVYQDYWKHRVDERFAEFLRGRRQREMLDAFREFFNDAEIKFLDNAQSEDNPDGMPVEGALGLSFLATFYSAVFMPELNPVLRPILIDGEFIKRENRLEFTEAYNSLISLEDSIKMLEANIAPDGDLGLRYAQAKNDISSLPVKRRKLQLLVEEASEAGEQILADTKKALLSMANVLKGIAAKASSGPYESLSNMKDMVKKQFDFAEAVTGIAPKLEKAALILDDIAIEQGE